MSAESVEVGGRKYEVRERCHGTERWCMGDGIADRQEGVELDKNKELQGKKE